MPIRAALRSLYPPHWRELSDRVRFEHAGRRYQGYGRPHLAELRCLPDDGSINQRRLGATAVDGQCYWPDLVKATRLRRTRVVLAAAHLDSRPHYLQSND